MKRIAIFTLVFAFLGALLVIADTTRVTKGGTTGTTITKPVTGVSSETDLVKLLESRYTRAELEGGVYVGSEFCIACHGSNNPEVVEWRHTLHAFALRKPMGMYSLQGGKGVMADYDKNGIDDFKQGLDFNAITSTFDAQKPNAPILSYDANTDTYYIQLGPTGLRLLVAATWAGNSAGNGQRYMCRIPVTDTPTGYSNAIYFGPFSWGGSNFSSNASNWYDGSTPKYAPGIASSALVSLQGQNYLKNCAGCHITGIRKAYVTAGGEYVVNPFPASLVPLDSPNYPDLDGDSLPDVAGIGCESCHGPGSMHILGAGDPALIVNPSAIVAGPGYAQANHARAAVCLQCHVRVASAPTKSWGFTYDETNNTGFKMSNPPDDLTKYQVSTAVKWPDGVAYTSARIDSYYSSDHYLGSHGIACNDCHNAHSETTNPAQLRDIISRGSGVQEIPAHVENDSFCLACHATHGPFAGITKEQVKAWDENFQAIRGVIEDHTHHAFAADRTMGVSNCITCHMATSHTFTPARPEDTITYKDVTTGTATGNINSCSRACHRGNAIIWSDVPANLTYTDTKYGTANEVKLAEHLVTYFGPGGTWWDTTPGAQGSAEKATTDQPSAKARAHFFTEYEE